ncbi:MAG: hypothetical protein NZU63_02125 [Gemmataceae bacterium]|nr:hypothetical protein [Gemmataceae bacterium]MDW8242982.1 hypothetical protein [Thermogemmata sp.]
MAKKKKRKEEIEELEEAKVAEVEEAVEEPATLARRPPAPKPRNDAYVMMLGITFLSLIVGCVLMYLDAAQYEGKNPPQAVAPTVPELGKAMGGGPTPPAPPKQ